MGRSAERKMHRSIIFEVVVVVVLVG
jgi:hypothetical protein